MNVNINNETYGSTFDRKVYAPKDVSRMLGIGRDKAYALFKSKGFPATKIGKTYFIIPEKFEKWLNDSAGKEYLL